MTESELDLNLRTSGYIEEYKMMIENLTGASDFLAGVVPEPADKVAEEARGGDGDGETAAGGGRGRRRRG